MQSYLKGVTQSSAEPVASLQHFELWISAAYIGNQFSSKIANQMSLYYDANLGIHSEVTLQRFNLPGEGSNRFAGHRIYIGGDATKQKCRSDKMTGDEFTEGTSVSRDPNCPLHDE